MRRLYVAALNIAGLNVLPATDGAEALSFVAKTTPRLLILDIMMPHLDGIETCRRARKIIGDDIPILFLSALDRIDILRDCLAAGGDDYLVKADDIEKIVKRIKTWLQHEQRQGLGARRKTLLQNINAEVESTQRSSSATQS